MFLLVLVIVVAVVVAAPGAKDIVGVRWSATPGIPIIETAVKYLQNGRFKHPTRMEKLVIVCRDPFEAGPVAERSLKRISPEEEHHALILATARDVRRGIMIQEWAAVWLSQPATFRIVQKVSLTSVADSEAAALFFEAGQLREKIGEDYEAMYLTTAAWLWIYIRGWVAFGGGQKG